MNQRFQHTLIMNLLCASVLTCAVGCQSGLPGRSVAGAPGSSTASETPTGLAKWLPFQKKNDEGALPPTLIAPSERMEQLEKLAKRARRMSPEEQGQISAQLAQEATSEDDPLIRIQIVRTLAALETPAATAALSARLNDPDSDVRIAVCEGLASRGDAEAIRILSAALASDTDIDVRLAAARALGETGNPAAIKGLAVGLEEDDPAMQYRVVQSLRKLSPQDFGDDVPAWRQYLAGDTPPQKTASLWSRIRRKF